MVGFSDGPGVRSAGYSKRHDVEHDGMNWVRIVKGDEDEMYGSFGGDDFRAEGRAGRRYLLGYDSQAALWVCSCDDGWFIEVRTVDKAKDRAEKHERNPDEPAKPTQLRH